ncbi:MAG: FHA domain-containing protein [Actinobacteria bacterium]|nr:FHA domain-containing protein [Actinomycetota bacterium]
MFARAYRSAIRPITIGRELLGLIDSTDKSGSINPNFVVNLNVDDYAAFADTLKIGRQASCRVVFNDSNVSREHAQLRRTAEGWKILDLGSTNGTKINGLKISEEQLLVNGDDLSFGTSGARFEIS